MPRLQLRHQNKNKKFLRDISRSPLFLTLASGVGAYVIGRTLVSYYRDHPEIADFFKENIQSLEKRLKEMRENWSDQQEAMPRH